MRVYGLGQKTRSDLTTPPVYTTHGGYKHHTIRDLQGDVARRKLLHIYIYIPTTLVRGDQTHTSFNIVAVKRLQQSSFDVLDTWHHGMRCLSPKAIDKKKEEGEEKKRVAKCVQR